MTDIELDPAVLRARAARLGVLAERLAELAGTARRDAARAGPRYDELVTGVGRHATELAWVADGLRRAAAELSAADRGASGGLGAITEALTTDNAVRRTE
ncbi:MAG TPA: hypothetical protein VGH99_23265 [Pseudonocardia sp.]|jgi:hypothetical protein